MKHLNNTIKESIFDDNIGENTDKLVELNQIWKDLTDTYGSMIRHWDVYGCSVKNIDFDKKGRIIFVDWPMKDIVFDMQIDGMPDSVIKRGFGEFKLPVKIYGAYGNSLGGCKLSSLGFITPSKTSLSINSSKVEFDVCPKFKEIDFWESFITNPMRLPKTQPKNCKITFNEGTVTNIAYWWAKEFFKTHDVTYSGKIIVEK